MMEEKANRAALSIGFAIAYAIGSYLINVFNDPDESINLRIFGKTVLLGLISGGIVYSQGENLSPEAVITASNTGVIILDKILNKFLDDPELPGPIEKF